jgi:pimeloyl-ACP methyl ester carboxylesterase
MPRLKANGIEIEYETFGDPHGAPVLLIMGLGAQMISWDIDDVLVPVDNGRSVAAAIPGDRLLELDGMGHDLPKRVWPQVLDAIEELARQATPLQRR